MTKNSFDQFSKQFLEEFLLPLGAVETSHEVSGEAQFVDVYFIPNLESTTTSPGLGLLGRIAQTPCLIEPFRNQPSSDEVRSCLLKLYQVHGDYRRRARREHENLPEVHLPQLWVLASSASKALLSGFGASPENDWESGIYFLSPSLKTVIIAINQLPCTQETLLLRLLGEGKTQRQAITEVLAFDTKDPRRSSILKLLASWKISIEVTEQVAEAEKELLMALSQAYLEWEQQTEQRGVQQGAQQEARLLVLRQLNRRVGMVPEDLEAQISSLALDELESLGDALLDFTSLSDLQLWLQSHVSSL
jgi:Domain of unknown function (DUF4351)